MQALSMIDMGAKAPETVSPVKSAEPKKQDFGKVLGAQNRQEKQADVSESKTKQQPAEKVAVAKQNKPEERPVQKQQTDKAIAEETTSTQAEASVKAEPTVKADATVKAEPKVQHAVVDLLKAITNGDLLESGEEAGSMEELLTQLVQQLESTELKGEQVLTGIDLSGLVEQLQVVSEEGGEEQLTLLISQLEEQLAIAGGLMENAELAANMLPVADQQAAAPILVGNLAQARQILQKALDSVTTQKAPSAVTEGSVVAEENVVAESKVSGQELLLGKETAEEIDPRFAGLLKPRSQNNTAPQQSLRAQVQGNNANSNPAQLNPTEAAPVVAEATPEQTDAGKFAELLSSNPKQAMDNLAQQVQGQVQPNATAQTQGMAGKLMPETPMVQLPSGQQVAESQIFDQVVARFSGGFNGASGKMVLRMQPAELGSLRIELAVEGDRITANIQAQSQQVQEVLERNLPQLRNALAEQGLKIDQFKVDVNQEQGQQNQFDQFAQQQQQRQQQDSHAQSRWQQNSAAEEQIIPLAHLMQNGGGGISLHV